LHVAGPTSSKIAHSAVIDHDQLSASSRHPHGPVVTESNTVRARSRIRYYLRRLGPGLVTGAANDDPAAVGTHAQVGAQFGAASLWLAPYTLPLTAVVLEMCAQIGNITGRGLVTILRFHYPRWVLCGAVTLLAVANVVNLAADLGVMAASVRMIVGGPVAVWLLLLAAGSAALQVFVAYGTYARVLKLLALSLLVYVVAAVLVPQDWGRVVAASLVPTTHWDGAFMIGVVAVLGTRLSPYVLVWQPAQVVEEDINDGQLRLAQRMGASTREVRAAQLDVIAGSLIANLVTWGILLTSSATLHAHGIVSVESAAQAADALRPAAGRLAYALFALGILATGLLAVPVLAGGVAYAIGEAMGWKRGLTRDAVGAPKFYGVIVGCIAVAVAINVFGINPIRALVLSQIVNGLVAIPLVYLVLHVCNNANVMGNETNGHLANSLGWVSFGVIAAAGAVAVWSLLH
jgi:Mn2+/Fe2+ NRAMP family transporter